MTTATEHRYVVTDDQILGGEPIVQGTRTPVRAIVEIYRLGVAAEEIPNHLRHLSLAQVFDAVATNPSLTIAAQAIKAVSAALP